MEKHDEKGQRQKLFRRLEQELNLRLNAHDWPLRSRATQIAYSKEASTILGEWLLKNRDAVKGEMGKLFAVPSGEEEYRRNAVFAPSDSRIGIFAHVWRGGGATRIHHHDGFLGMASPLGDGIVETKFSLPLGKQKPMEDNVRPISQESSKSFSVGEVMTIPRGPGSFHCVRNVSPENCLVVEIYVFSDEPLDYAAKAAADPSYSPLHFINTAIPIVFHSDKYYVDRCSVDNITSSLGGVIRRTAEGKGFLGAKEEAEALDSLELGVPGKVYTLEGETFASRDDVQSGLRPIWEESSDALCRANNSAAWCAFEL